MNYKIDKESLEFMLSDLGLEDFRVEVLANGYCEVITEVCTYLITESAWQLTIYDLYLKSKEQTKHIERLRELKMTTTNLSDFGYRELDMLKDLISAMIEQGLPDNFSDDEVAPMMNQNSGNVFLTNSDYQVAMLNGTDLEMFYTLSYHGTEGFASDLYVEFCHGNINDEDLEQLADILESERREDEAEEIRNSIKE